MSEVELILYGHPNCPLCRRLEKLLQPHLNKSHFSLRKHDIYDNDEWQRRYAQRVPVLTCSNRIILEGRPSEQELANSLDHLVTS